MRCHGKSSSGRTGGTPCASASRRSAPAAAVSAGSSNRDSASATQRASTGVCASVRRASRTDSAARRSSGSRLTACDRPSIADARTDGDGSRSRRAVKAGARSRARGVRNAHRNGIDCRQIVGRAGLLEREDVGRHAVGDRVVDLAEDAAGRHVVAQADCREAAHREAVALDHRRGLRARAVVGLDLALRVEAVVQEPRGVADRELGEQPRDAAAPRRRGIGEQADQERHRAQGRLEALHALVIERVEQLVQRLVVLITGRDRAQHHGHVGRLAVGVLERGPVDLVQARQWKRSVGHARAA